MTHVASPAASLFFFFLQLVFVENTADDPSRRKPDITKAKTLLGWQPKVGAACSLQLCCVACCSPRG